MGQANMMLRISLLGTTFLASAAVAAGPMSTAFTFQARLTELGRAVNGPFDFRFQLFDMASGGNLLGTDHADDVPVTGGLFTVQVDFGVGVFDGNARFVEIGVRPGDSPQADPYELLSLRQELTATPHALYSTSAPWDGLSGVPAGFADNVDDDTIGALSCANGQIAQWDGGAWVCVDDDGGLALPFAATHNGNEESAFEITETGTGHAGFFRIDNPLTSWAALFTVSNGLWPALHAVQQGGMSAAQFENVLTANAQPTLIATTNGLGVAVQGTTRPGVDGSGVAGSALGNGNGVQGTVAGSGNAIQGTITNNLGRAGFFQSTSSGNSNSTVLIESNEAFSGKGLEVQSTGSGDAGYFEIGNTSSGGEAVEARTNGLGNAVGAQHSGTSGRAGYFIQDGASNVFPAVEVLSHASGPALLARIERTTNDDPALDAQTDGDGAAVRANTTGEGPAAHLSINNAANTNNALLVTTNGTGRAALFQANNAGTTVPAVQISTQGTGPALDVSGNTEKHGDLVIEGAVDIGYEIVSVTLSGDPISVEALCPSGKKVLGGGCSVAAFHKFTQSQPTSDGRGWFCVSVDASVMTAYAMCARAK